MKIQFFKHRVPFSGYQMKSLVNFYKMFKRVFVTLHALLFLNSERITLILCWTFEWKWLKCFKKFYCKIQLWKKVHSINMKKMEASMFWKIITQKIWSSCCFKMFSQQFENNWMIKSNGAFMTTNNMKIKITSIIRFGDGFQNSKVNGHGKH